MPTAAAGNKLDLSSGAIYAASDQESILFLGKAKRSEQPSQNNISLYASDYFLEDKLAWYIYPHYEKISSLRLFDILEQNAVPYLEALEWHEASKEEYAKQFEFCQSLIQNKTLEKIVSSNYAFSKQKINLGMAFRMILNCFKNASQHNIYAQWSLKNSPEDFFILGASPEVLFQSSNELSKTMALAGTSLNENLKDFQQDPKEAQEHQYVVQDILAQLDLLQNTDAAKQIAMQKPVLGNKQFLSYGNLSHMLSPIEFNTQSMPDFMDMIHYLHPTPALGVYPRHFTHPIASDYKIQKEFSDAKLRKNFGAGFGVLIPKISQHCVVAIRNIMYHGGICYLHSGCGIVKDSKFESEFLELQRKRNNLKKFLEI